MARYLLDTDAIIDVLSGYMPTATLIQNPERTGDALCVGDVVLAEVYAGLRPQDRLKAERLLDACVFLTAGPEAARQAGEWRYAFGGLGVTLSTTDALIAATAHAHGAALLTGNSRDYPMQEVTLMPLPRRIS